MKNKPNANDVLSELSRDSVFFKRAVEGTETIAESRPSSRETDPERNGVPIAEPLSSVGGRPVLPVRPVRDVRRKKIRHPFDIYDAQLETLRELSTDDR